MLQANEVSVERVGGRILDRVSVAVRPGRLVAVVGPAGAGKSTLIELLAGRRAPDAGRVTLDGQCLSLWAGAGLARRCAVLAQHPQLAFGFSALDVVLLGRGAACRCSASAHDRAVALEALRAADALGLHERPYHGLSGGERQRVRFARMLAQVWDRETRPAYLLLDEPEAGLDVAQRNAVLQAARRFAATGGGVLAVLHDLSLATRYADDAVVLAAGRVIGRGAPSESLDPKVLGAAYGIAVRRTVPGQATASRLH